MYKRLHTHPPHTHTHTLIFEILINVYQVVAYKYLKFIRKLTEFRMYMNCCWLVAKFREGDGTPLQYSCLEKSHGRRSLVGCSPWGR